MIDERINKTLKELEQGLKDVESARKQVERTVSSFSNLNTTTWEYVSKLGTITTKIQELVGYVGKDYAQKVKDFEEDREAVIKSSNTATEKLSNATEEFKESLFEIQTKLKYSLIVNAVSLVVIGAILFLLMK